MTDADGAGHASGPSEPDDGPSTGEGGGGRGVGGDATPSDPARTEASRPGPSRPGPIGGDMAAVLYGLTDRFRVPALTQRHDSTAVLGLFAFVNGVISIALMSVAAMVTGAPFIFPSLGPTAFLLFYTPMTPAASPRNTMCGHAIGAAAGYLSLVIFGLTDNPASVVEGVAAGRVGAAALSLGLTAGLMVWFRVPHPPAGATTLIVSLGILREPEDLLVLMVAVALLVVQAYVINHLAGIDYPAWAPAHRP